MQRKSGDDRDLFLRPGPLGLFPAPPAVNLAARGSRCGESTPKPLYCDPAPLGRRILGNLSVISFALVSVGAILAGCSSNPATQAKLPDPSSEQTVRVACPDGPVPEI